jgi:hypothetical protein
MLLLLLLLAGCADPVSGSAGAVDASNAAGAEAGTPEGDADVDAADVDATDVDAAIEDATPPDYAGIEPAAVHGTVRIFGPPGGPLEGAEVFVLEHPEIRTRSDANGQFTLAQIPAGPVSLVMLADGYPENQLGTQQLLGEDLEGLDFQAVSDLIFRLFVTLSESEADPARCQVATTVTRWFEGRLPTVHGEPGVTTTITPAVPEDHGPVYFSEQVLPTPALTETSVDGGVAWTNLQPGHYVLHAHKEGVAFEEVHIRCRPGVLVNAGPPRGLQALNPGSGY